MDQLSGIARLMMVTDLDMTLVDHDDPDNLSLLRFNALWEAYYRPDSLLVFSTGRSPASYKQLRNKKPLLTPDITILSVGTMITYGRSMVPDNDWVQYLDHKWDRHIVTEETAKLPDLTPQSEKGQGPHKVSFYVDKVKAPTVIETLTERLRNRGLEVKIIFSNGIALDILPQGAGKGEALAYLLKKFNVNGKSPANTLVCGDSGNDAELFTVPEVYGVMVNNALEELLQWREENAKDNRNIVHATERCAAGIIQAINMFKLGPDVSPRELRNFQDRKVENFNIGHEVVKFYLFYERWLRAEVEKSDLYLQYLELVLYSVGTFVHPSGVERPIRECIDVMTRRYGDKRGKQFRVWVDQVSFSQIGSDAWLVKFVKWEISGENKHGCVTTVLLSEKQADNPGGFIWVHIHQTWLDDAGAEDQNTWLF